MRTSIDTDNVNQIHRKTGISGEYRAIWGPLYTALSFSQRYEEFLEFVRKEDLRNLSTLETFYKKSEHKDKLNPPSELGGDAQIINKRIELINKKLRNFRRFLSNLQKRAHQPDGEEMIFQIRLADLLSEVVLLNMYLGPSDAGLGETEKRVVEVQSKVIREILQSEA